jgi:hypothetical protein
MHCGSGAMIIALPMASLLVCAADVRAATPCVTVHASGHYFEYQGKPLVLLSSDHHYGAVIDSEFDYVRYLKYLGSQRMNVTRIYPGGRVARPERE